MAVPDNVLTSEVKDGEKKRKFLWIGLVAVLLIAIIGLQLYFLGFKAANTGNVVLITKEESEQSEKEVVPPGLEDIEKYTLMAAILRLETVDASEKLQFANVVNSINSNIFKSNNDVLKEKWKTLSDCFGKECAKTIDYNEFERVALIELFGTQNAAKGLTDRVFGKGALKDTHLVLIELLNLKKAASENNVISESKSVSYINDMVVKLNEPKVTDKWNSLLACDYKCDKYNELMIALTQNYLDKV